MEDVKSTPPGPSPAQLQIRLDQLDLTLRQLQQIRERLEDSELRFRRMTHECSGLLEGLVRLDQDHAGKLAALNERFGDLVAESAHRLHRFERGIGHEWTVLRQMYEAPVEHLKHQAEELHKAWLDAVKHARLGRGLLEDPLRGGSDLPPDWSRRLTASAEAESLDTTQPAESGSSSIAERDASAFEPWSLNEVAHLHQELRKGSAESNLGGLARRATPHQSSAAASAPDSMVSTSENMRASAERASTATVAKEESSEWAASSRVIWALTIAGIVVVAIALGGYTAQLRDRMGDLESITREAAARISAAERHADEAQQASQRRISEAEQTALKAQSIADILAAPDLRRFDMVGRSAGRGAYAQVLWSRSRGLVVSASRLPALAEGRTYQVWVFGEQEPVSAGLLNLDTSGRGSLIINAPLRFPRRTALGVTLEAEGGASRPSGPVYLIERS